MTIYPRISGRLGGFVTLDVTFFKNGVAQDPFAIRRIDIYKGSIKSLNLVDQIHLLLPDHSSYPAPILRTGAGKLQLQYKVPSSLVPGEIYYDVWNYVGDQPLPIIAQGSNGTGTEIVTGTDVLVTDLDNGALWQSETGHFWVFENNWISDDGLLVPKLAFEPLDKKLRKGEIRTIEVAFYPLPRHKYNYNTLVPLLPNLAPTISFSTVNCESIIVNAPCKIGLRQGHYKELPYVIQYQVNTNNFLIGSYKYEVKLVVGGETIISEPMLLMIEG